jgi:hypothetical protein
MSRLWKLTLNVNMKRDENSLYGWCDWRARQPPPHPTPHHYVAVAAEKPACSLFSEHKLISLPSPEFSHPLNGVGTKNEAYLSYCCDENHTMDPTLSGGKR